MLLALELIFPALLLFVAFFRNRLVVSSAVNTYVSIIIYCTQVVGLFFTFKYQHAFDSALRQNNFSFFYSYYAAIIICFFHISYTFDFAKRIISRNTIYAFLMILAFSTTSDMWILYLVFSTTIFFVLWKQAMPTVRQQVSLLLTIFACLLLQGQLEQRIFSIIIGSQAFIALLALLFLVYKDNENRNVFSWALFLVVIFKFMFPVSSYFGMAICVVFAIAYLVKIFGSNLLVERKSLDDLFFVLAPFDLLLGHSIYFVQTLFIFVIYESFQIFNFKTRYSLAQSVLFCFMTCAVLSIGDQFSELNLLQLFVLLFKVVSVLFFLFSEQRQIMIQQLGFDKHTASIVIIPSLILLYKYHLISMNPILGLVVICAFGLKIISLYYPALLEKINLSNFQWLKTKVNLKIRDK
ncbi:MAG: hypothetical protein A2X86_05200 [Bdellovibrionales bacterium GWA2_49_15]|nr:MAG: hypothetical protein A2X86_05200 [Bdellovibrionales bacterium GWA2_49_15]